MGVVKLQEVENTLQQYNEKLREDTEHLNNQKQVLDEIFEDKQNIEDALDEAAAKFSNNKAKLLKLFKGIP